MKKKQIRDELGDEFWRELGNELVDEFTFKVFNEIKGGTIYILWHELWIDLAKKLMVDLREGNSGC